MIHTQLNHPGDVQPQLPEQIELRCKANEDYSANLLVMSKLILLDRNSINFVVGPSSATGRITVDREKMQGEISRALQAFPSDYANEGAFAGVIAFSPMSSDDIDAAIRAYEIYQAFIDYPHGYRQMLNDARSYLADHQLARLSVEVLSEHLGIRYIVESKAMSGF